MLIAVFIVAALIYLAILQFWVLSAYQEAPDGDEGGI